MIVKGKVGDERQVISSSQFAIFDGKEGRRGKGFKGGEDSLFAGNENIPFPLLPDA